jgi:hypothetical protein
MNLKKVGCGVDSAGSGQSVAGSFEHNKHSRLIRGKEFLDQWSSYYLLKDSVNGFSYIIFPAFIHIFLNY